MAEIWQTLNGNWDMERKTDGSPNPDHFNLHFDVVNEEITLDRDACTNEQAESGPNGIFFKRGTETYIGTYDQPSDSITGTWSDTSGNSGDWTAQRT